MASQVVVPVSGVSIIKNRLWSYPEADIGDTIGYLKSGEGKEYEESKVVKIVMEQMLDKSTSKIVEAVVYTLADGTVLTEEEVQYSWNGD